MARKAEWYNLVYINGKKVLPSTIMSLLTDVALAIWICDDGTYTGSGLIIQTNAFTVPEVELLIQAALRAAHPPGRLLIRILI